MPPRTAASARARVCALALLTATALLATGQPSNAAPHADTADPVNRAFAEAAHAYDVPRDLLAAVGYGESRLNGHGGEPSQANGYGVMHLASNPVNRSLEKASELTGESAARLRRDTTANILGGAAVLRDHADALGLDAAERRDVDSWYQAVARYSAAEGQAATLYADTVFTFLAEGVTAKVPGGEEVLVPARPVDPDKGELSASDVYVQSEDYPSARWVPAYSGNYVVDRKATVDKVVIHTTQGSYAGSISWYQNPESKVSAHYTIRSSDGEVTQSVREKDTAWHMRQRQLLVRGHRARGLRRQPGLVHGGHVPFLGRADQAPRGAVLHPEEPVAHHRAQRGARRHAHRPRPQLGLEPLHGADRRRPRQWR